MTEIGSGMATRRRATPRLLDELSALAPTLAGVRRTELLPGDRVLVATRNSIYALTATAGERYLVAGGWFRVRGEEPAEVGVNGCTAGGSALFFDILAAPGLFLEFANGVTTTRIRQVRVLRCDDSTAA